MTDLSHYVSGARVPGKSGRFADVFNPATGMAEKRVLLASAAEVGEVVGPVVVGTGSVKTQN